MKIVVLYCEHGFSFSKLSACLDVFSRANEISSSYRLIISSERSGPVQSDLGISVYAEAISGIDLHTVDILSITGSSYIKKNTETGASCVPRTLPELRLETSNSRKKSSTKLSEPYYVDKKFGSSKDRLTALNMNFQERKWNELEHWIQRNITKRLSVEQLSDHMAMSSRTFTRHCNKRFKMSPKKLVEHIRLEMTIDMIVNTHLTLSSIAMSCGYIRAENMQRSFIRQLGCSPSTFRKKAA